MKMSFLILLAGLFSFSSVSFGQSPKKKLCVIGFERRDFPVSLGLEKIFKENSHTRLVIEGGPKDLEACLQEDFEEIVLVTHAFFVDGDKDRVTLGYFQELIGETRKSFIEMNKKAVVDAITELDRSIEEFDTVKKRFDRRRLKKILKRVEETPADLPLYASPQVLFGRYFDRLNSLVQKKLETGELRLKKFRLMTCASDLILEKYPFFNGLREMGIELDVAPSSRIASFFKGHQVTNLNGPWLKQSLK